MLQAKKFINFFLKQESLKDTKKTSFTNDLKTELLALLNQDNKTTNFSLSFLLSSTFSNVDIIDDLSLYAF